MQDAVRIPGKLEVKTSKNVTRFPIADSELHTPFVKCNTEKKINVEKENMKIVQINH